MVCDRPPRFDLLAALAAFGDSSSTSSSQFLFFLGGRSAVGRFSSSSVTAGVRVSDSSAEVKASSPTVPAFRLSPPLGGVSTIAGLGR